MAIDSFILKIDLVYQNLFIHNSNDEEARGERFQATVETIYASELKKVILLQEKRVETTGDLKN